MDDLDMLSKPADKAGQGLASAGKAANSFIKQLTTLGIVVGIVGGSGWVLINKPEWIDAINLGHEKRPTMFAHFVAERSKLYMPNKNDIGYPKNEVLREHLKAISDNRAERHFACEPDVTINNMSMYDPKRCSELESNLADLKTLHAPNPQPPSELALGGDEW